MRRIITLALLLGLAGWSCSSGGGGNPGFAGSTGSAATPDSPDPLLDFTGIWRGRSISSMNAASAKITFAVKRQGNRIKGDYRCAPGNAICRNNVQRGWVTGQVSARGFRVEMEDTSWCMYFMDDFYPPKADGEYTCYMNGGIADQGTFKLKGPPAPSEEDAPARPGA
jgi:hypothetical protein